MRPICLLAQLATPATAWEPTVEYRFTVITPKFRRGPFPRSAQSSASVELIEAMPHIANQPFEGGAAKVFLAEIHNLNFTL